MKILNISEGRKVKLPTLRLPKISIFEEGADKKVAMYRAIILLLVFIILVVLGQAYGEDIKSGKAFGRESVQVEPEKVQAQEVVTETVEWIDGDRVTRRSDGTMSVTPAEVFMSAEELKQQDANYQKARKIETYLRVNRGNAPLAAYADKFVEVANKYNLDYRLLPAISVMESGGGKSNFRSYNAWGWGKKTFTSFEQGIETVGKGLRTGYFDKGADTVDKIAPIYCPPNATNWARNVKQFMNEIESV